MTKVSEDAWSRLDARAERAGLALGAWIGLLAEDAALARPGLSEAQLEALADVRARVARVGGAVNQVAVGEHIGRKVTDAELAAVLDRVSVRIDEAMTAIADGASVFRAPQRAKRAHAEGLQPAAGRRTAVAGEGERRGRQVKTKVTAAERARVEAAAASQGLAIGAWLGQLLEDPESARPLLGEAWGAVFALRKALRRVATNLAQIESARASRGRGADEQLDEIRQRVDAAIRACLELSGSISDAAKTGAAA